MRPISLLVKPVSADCNLACQYCFYLPKAALYPESTVHRMCDDVLEALMAQYMPMAGPQATICWQGGEPTLAGLDFYRRAVEFEKRYGLPGQAVGNGFQTNGVLVDDDWAAFFSEYRFLVGVSLDGPQAIHDSYRKARGGQGSFATVMAAIECLRRHGVEFNILTMVTPASASRARDILQFFMQNGLRYLQFIPCAEGNASGELADYSVTPEEYGRFLCDAFDVWRAEGWQRLYVRFFNEVLGAYLGYQERSCTFKEQCGDYVVVEHNGDVYCCDFFVEPEWYLGNILATPLGELIESARFAEFAEQKGRLGAACRSCEWMALCNGECPKYRLISGGIGSPTYFCAAYQRFFEQSRAHYQAVAHGIARPSGERAVGRNEPCPCGSGRKYKRCCGRAAQSARGASSI